MKINFTNGWSAEYDGDGKWLLLDDAEETNVVRVGYLEPMIQRYGLTRKGA